MSKTHKRVRTEQEKANFKVVVEMLSRIGDKWTVLIVGALAEGTMRYTDLRDSVEGISQRMLTLTLKALEEDGLVVRTIYPVMPPHVEYTLTKMGRTLTRPVLALHQWTVKHRAAMLKARKVYAKGMAKQADISALSMRALRRKR